MTTPLLHIADATASAIRGSSCRTVALLGTRYPMEQAFSIERLTAQAIACTVPGEPRRALVHRIIFDELCKGIVDDESRRTCWTFSRTASGVAPKAWCSVARCFW